MASSEIKIALAGNPNSGKTTLFNALTGSNQFVGNWPGVTVEKKEGKLKKHDGVTVTDLPGIYSLSPYTLEEVVARNYLIDENPDVILNIVDGTNLERNLYLTTQLTELGIPVVITYDTAVTEVVDQYSPIKLPKNTLRELTKRYLKILLGRSDAVIIPTESIEKELLNSIGVQPKKIAVIPTGIDTEKFTKTGAGAALREKYGLTGKRILLYVGRLSVEKNLPLLIRTLHELPEDIHLLIVGSGPSKDELEGLVEELGLDERVTFVGYLHDKDLVDPYSCPDAFVSPSMFETQGFTVQEAMSCGLPVACARGRAYTQLVNCG
jgi:glycosyltransferase involved in cell wall biosynthesis